jgi:DnaJ-class molecular chaperone
MNPDNEEEVCQSCLGTGNIAIPVFSEHYHFPVLYEHEECPMCGGSGRRKQ